MPIPSERGRHKRSLLRENAYVSLRDAIVNGTFAPGEQLRDAELEEWLGISRTPIRDAIARLESAGLVHTEPGRSTVVSTIERKAILDAQSVAASTHALAVRIAVPLMGKREFDAMEKANKQFAAAFAAGDVDLALRSDDEFHGVAVTASQNQVIPTVLEHVTPVLRRIERLRFSSLSGRESIAQHKQIVKLCRSGDADGAAAAVQRNWETLALLVDRDELAEPQNADPQTGNSTA
ncbi:GntR family transcriptional regulator (plasmid) [Rhodococcus pseudokoreensis]|uniref:GntR family transcriptional regulator n=1 Tax=Rhodococcus pseudokoreensis TaxID=2811421 RepID=A0A974ZR87_9NOCA|nr:MULTISPECIES: GntR family transcriptional regulator [Rhodococcus]QSE87340.1 GntR family transcriptional regulator [Rhodococcus pseudokoreensis]GLK39980.1 GntR family transcriptional regulator [Rhodococcus wratislaviensis]